MLNPKNSGVDEKYYTITSVVADKRIKTGMKFTDIVRGNQSPKSPVRVNPVLPVHKKTMT